MVSHQDWLPTILAAAGVPDVADRLRRGHQVNGKTFKVHIDGYDMRPYLSGEVDASPRREYFYVNDDAQLVALRVDEPTEAEPRKPGTGDQPAASS